MLTASKSNTTNQLRTAGKSKVTTTSVSISKSHEEDYNLLRQFLLDNKLSLGEYLVQSFVLNYRDEYLKTSLE